MPFKKGQSGNPGGKKPQDPEFLAAVKRLSPKALAVLEKWMDHPKESSAAIRAATRILEYAHGMPTQRVEGTGKDGAITLEFSIAQKLIK